MWPAAREFGGPVKLIGCIQMCETRPPARQTTRLLSKAAMITGLLRTQVIYFRSKSPRNAFALSRISEATGSRLICGLMSLQVSDIPAPCTLCLLATYTGLKTTPVGESVQCTFPASCGPGPAEEELDKVLVAGRPLDETGNLLPVRQL